MSSNTLGITQYAVELGGLWAYGALGRYSAGAKASRVPHSYVLVRLARELHIVDNTRTANHLGARWAGGCANIAACALEGPGSLPLQVAGFLLEIR